MKVSIEPVSPSEGTCHPAGPRTASAVQRLPGDTLQSECTSLIVTPAALQSPWHSGSWGSTARFGGG